MIALSAEEFAAKRRTAQTRIEEALRPVVQEGVDLSVDTHGWDEVLDEVLDQYQIAFSDEGDGKAPTLPRGWRKELRETLQQTTSPRTEATVDRISTWLATWVLSQATMAVINTDPDDLLMEWVDMGDKAVREAHARTNGQQRPVGEPFDVDGVEMPYPGWPGAPIELWINCRCTLRPVLSNEVIEARLLRRHAAAVAKSAALGGVDWFDENGTFVRHTEFVNNGGEVMEDEITEVAPEDTKESPADIVVQWHGVLAPEGVPSGDGRQFRKGSLTTRPMPLPLTWQRASSDGHDGSVTVAKIEKAVRVGDEMRGAGSFIVNAEADEVIALIAEFGRYGVSVDADAVEFEMLEESEVLDFIRARIASASIVSIPAFAEAWVSLGPPPEGFFDGEEIEEEGVVEDEALVASSFADVAPGLTEDGPGWLTHPVDTDRLRDYWVRGAGAAKIGWGTPGDFNRCRVNLAEYIKPQYLSGYCANRHKDALGFWPGEHSAEPRVFNGDATAPAVSLVASVASVKAPSEWFKNPEFTEKTHLTVTEEGEVFGHIAAWDTCHGAFLDTCVLPPKSQTEYAYFATGQVLTDEGPVNTGPITIAKDPKQKAHARGRAPLRPAMAHYENTCVAVADVAVGEDSFGIWAHGWIRPGATPEQVIALRASDVSGDWRLAPNGNMEMIAALGVNSGGFHTPRVAASIEDGKQISLVAAGFLPREQEGEENLEKFGELIGAFVAKELSAREQRKARMAELAAQLKED